ncbi:hypothetical protein GCM10027071_18740 [Microbacterium marinum]
MDVEGVHEPVGDAGADDTPPQGGDGGGVDQAGCGEERHPAILSEPGVRRRAVHGVALRYEPVKGAARPFGRAPRAPLDRLSTPCKAASVPTKAGSSAYRRTPYFHRTHNKENAMQPRANRLLAVRVARRILAVLDARGRSPEWLAEVTGIAARKRDRRLHTTTPAGLTVDELNAIAIALDVHPSELLRD